MDFLSKFGTVEIAADSRISEIDKTFCKAHQKAYEAAISCFHELEYIWYDITDRQVNILSGIESGYATYLSSEDIDISASKIITHIKGLHNKFLGNLVSYFNSKYHISIDEFTVAENSLPPKPSDKAYDKEIQEKYEGELLNLILHYEDIVNFIFAQMDGRGFSEQAFHELTEKCHAAAWNSYQKKANFEVKKSVLQFSYGCSYSSWYSSSNWELIDGVKNILRGIAHFETGDYGIYPYGFDRLLGYGRCAADVFEFPTSKKVQQLKMFKNGRVDIKFSSEVYARQFSDKYLGLVC